MFLKRLASVTLLMLVVGCSQEQADSAKGKCRDDQYVSIDGFFGYKLSHGNSCKQIRCSSFGEIKCAVPHLNTIRVRWSDGQPSSYVVTSDLMKVDEAFYKKYDEIRDLLFKSKVDSNVDVDVMYDSKQGVIGVIVSHGSGKIKDCGDESIYMGVAL